MSLRREVVPATGRDHQRIEWRLETCQPRHPFRTSPWRRRDRQRIEWRLETGVLLQLRTGDAGVATNSASNGALKPELNVTLDDLIQGSRDQQRIEWRLETSCQPHLEGVAAGRDQQRIEWRLETTAFEGLTTTMLVSRPTAHRMAP